MKNFSKINFSCVCVGIAVTLAIFVLNTANIAYAEAERYDFPVFDRKETLIKFVSPHKPVTADKKDVRQRNEARRKSIAALLRHYNKKLDDEEAYEYAIYIMQACDKFEQDPFVIAAMVVMESSARNDAVSRGGDYGLMQVRWRVHAKKIRNKYPHIEEAKDMFNPKDNVLVGTEIFSVYHANANQDIRGALMYYTAGNKRMADKVFAVRSQLEKSYYERLRNS